PGGFGGVGPSRWCGPAEGPVGELIDLPLGVLFEPVVVTALWPAVTETRSSACFVRSVVLEVGLGGRPPADGAGAGRVPDLGQVLQPDPGIVTAGLVPVVAGIGVQGLQGDDQVRPAAGGAQPPGAVPSGRSVPAGRGEREPGFSRRSGAGALLVVPGFGAGAAVPDGVAVRVGQGHAPGCLRVARRGGGQVPGQPRV